MPGHAETPLPLLSYGPKSGLPPGLDAVWAKERGSLSLKKGLGSWRSRCSSMARQGQGVAWIPQTPAAEDIEARSMLDAGLGRFSVEVEIRLYAPVHGQTRIAEAFWIAGSEMSQIVLSHEEISTPITPSALVRVYTAILRCEFYRTLIFPSPSGTWCPKGNKP